MDEVGNPDKLDKLDKLDNSEQALWIGRVRVREDGRAREQVVRVWTDGAAPGPAEGVTLEWIEDPFQAAREIASAGGDPASADPWSLARAARATRRVSLEDGDCELAPPIRPSKIIGVGRNYRAHAAELGNEVPSSPLLFFKPPSCLLVSGQAIPLPRGYERIDFEGELVVVIGRRARDVRAEDAWAHVAGYLLGDDVSCRDLQRSDRQWTRAKGFDGFGPVGGFIRMTAPGWRLPGDELRLQTFVNDEPRQDAALALMVFDIPTLIAHVSECMTLEPGDLIFTGTPKGVGPLSPGEIVRVVSSGALELAPLVNPVV